MKVTKEDLGVLQGLVRSNGLLLAGDVLNAARAKRSPLHRFFNWDDTEAAELFRLQQANDLIVSVKVTIQPREGSESVTVRAFTSLNEDRKQGGGFRFVTTVLSDEELRAEMLKTALSELQALKNKYRLLTQLSKVFEEIDRVLGR